MKMKMTTVNSWRIYGFTETTIVGRSRGNLSVGEPKRKVYKVERLGFIY